MSDYQAARKAMVDSQVRPSDVTRYAIIEAMLETPREQFVPRALRDVAYAEAEIAIGAGRAILPPRSWMMPNALTMIVNVTATCSAISTKPALLRSIARQIGPNSIFLSYCSRRWVAGVILQVRQVGYSAAPSADTIASATASPTISQSIVTRYAMKS